MTKTANRFTKRASIALLLFNSISAAASTPADTTTHRRIDAEAISVTATKSPHIFTIFSGDTLFAAVPQTIESMLKSAPETDLRERGAKGVQADISIRGGSVDQSGVMLNGINFTDVRTGHQSLALPIDMEVVERAEIITRGVASSSLTGMINLNTINSDKQFFRANIEGGQHGYLYSNLSGNAVRGRTTLFGAASVRRSDGYIDNTDFSRTNLYMSLSHRTLHVGTFDIQAGYQTSAFGSNSFYSLAYPDQYEKTTTGLASVSWNKTIGLVDMRAYTSYRKNYDRFELFRENMDAPDWYKGHNYHSTDNITAGASAVMPWRYGRSMLSVDYIYNHILSNVLGEKMDKPKKVKGDEAYYTHAKARSQANVSLSHAMKVLGVSFDGAAGVALTSQQSCFIGHLAANYGISNSFSVNAGISKSMRLPTFTDLYYTTATHIGNSDLIAEKAVTVHAGADYTTGKFTSSATIYYRHGTDIIDWLRESEQDKWRSEQWTKIDSYGIELRGAYRFGGIVDNLSLSYGYVGSSKNNKGMISKYAMDYLSNKLGAAVSLKLSRSFSLALDATLYDRNGNYEIEAGKPLAFTPYCLVNGKVAYTRGIMKLYVDAQNIFSQKYFDFGGIAQPKSWISAGIVITL